MNDRKKAVRAKRRVVATSERYAAEAGLSIMKQGGNAIDAAVATAAALTVVEPTSNGIGSDSFAMIHFEGRLYGFNSSGPSSRNITIDQVKSRGFLEMPRYGVLPITVPGTPRGWYELVKRFGNLELKDVLKPAIDLARNGYVIGKTTGYFFEHAVEHYRKVNKGEAFEHFFEVFTDHGRPYRHGDVFASEMIARTLESIAETDAKSFYEGELADRIVSFMERHGGFIDKQDLASFQPEFVEPLSLGYRGHDVFELPPNGQGITALMALNLLKSGSYTEPKNAVHDQIEALKIAFSDTLEYVTDPNFMRVNPSFFLSDNYRRMRQGEIGAQVKAYEPIDYKSGGTVYLATADEAGNMVSFIQSNYMGFGSGIVIDGTGISMQNRGHTFRLDPGHANCLEPNKKTYHTIIPGFLMKEGKPVGPFGVMGGFMQPQGHVQVLMNMLDFGMDPQEALDAPRFRFDSGKRVAVEPWFSQDIRKDLARRGHDLWIDPSKGGFGRGQIILKTEQGYLAGTERRCEGFIACE
ncbi:MAG: gamma-glutamyltransferase family protein [Acholeplasmataceae bacterium]